MSEEEKPSSSLSMSPMDEPHATCPISIVSVGRKVFIQGLLMTCLRSVKHSRSRDPKLNLKKAESPSNPGRDLPMMRPPTFAGTAATRKVSSEMRSPAHLCRSVETHTSTSNFSMASRDSLNALRIRSSSSVRLVRCRAMTMMESVGVAIDASMCLASQSERNCLVR